jgi:predicted small secreted protein
MMLSGRTRFLLLGALVLALSLMLSAVWTTRG